MDLQVAGLQGRANIRKVLVLPGIAPGSHAYMADDLTSELLTALETCERLDIQFYGLLKV
jgi:hypothetical protein